MGYVVIRKICNGGTSMKEDVNGSIYKVQFMMAKGVFEDLEEYGIDYAIVKGHPDAIYKSGTSGNRTSSNIDILISRQNINKVAEIMQLNGFECEYPLERIDRVMVVANSHRLPSYQKNVGIVRTKIDIVFDMFWGEYPGERINLSQILRETIEIEVFGCRVKILNPLMRMVHLVLYRYMETNSLYYLMGHATIDRVLFEEVYSLYKRYADVISKEALYAISCQYHITPYVFYILYYTQKIVNDASLEKFMDVFHTEEGESLLECYGLTNRERKVWRIPFDQRLDKDVSKWICKELGADDIEKLERNRRIYG